MRAMLPVENAREVWGFLGMCSYYRSSIPNFSETAIVLIKLTKRFAKFVWSEECQVAFKFLKTSLTTVPILGYPDVNKPYIFYTDASNNCIGACFCQPCDEGKGTQPGMIKEKPYISYPTNLVPLKLYGPQFRKNAMPYIMLYKN